MSHFAKVNNGIVEQVIVAEQNIIDSGIVGDPSDWIQTSYNTFGNQHLLNKTPLRGNYAIVGGVYDSENDVFYDQQPYASWTLNETTWLWESPVAYPTDGNVYTWNESTQSWDSVE